MTGVASAPPDAAPLLHRLIVGYRAEEQRGTAWWGRLKGLYQPKDITPGYVSYL